MVHPLEKFQFCPRCGSSSFEEHDFKSKRCNKCNFIYYFNPSAATVAVIINENHELLVCRRAHDPAEGTLDLPGGFVDMNETIEEGMIREINEELGARAVIERFLFSLPNTYFYAGFTVHTVDCFFLCHLRKGDCIKAMDDADALYWISAEKICPEEFGLNSIRKGVERLLTDDLALLK